MDYFFSTDALAITGDGNTVSSEGTVTVDEMYAVASSWVSSCEPYLIIGPEQMFSVPTETSSVEIYGYSVRECEAVATSAVAEMDFGIYTNRIVYYEEAYE